MHAGTAWGRSEEVQDLRKKGQFLLHVLPHWWGVLAGHPNLQTTASNQRTRVPFLWNMARSYLPGVAFLWLSWWWYCLAHNPAGNLQISPAILLHLPQISMVCTAGPEIWVIYTLAHAVKEGSRVCAMEQGELSVLGWEYVCGRAIQTAWRCFTPWHFCAQYSFWLSGKLL